MFFPLHNLPAAPNGFKMQKAVFHCSAVKMPDVKQAQPASPILHYNTLFKTVCLDSQQASINRITFLGYRSWTKEMFKHQAF